MYEGLFIVAKEFNNLFMNNINNNKSGFLEKKIDNILNKKDVTLHEIIPKIVFELIAESEFYKFKIDNQQLLNNELSNQEKYQIFSEFFSEFQNNVIFKFIILNKSNIENWNNLENQISQLCKAVMFLKDNVANLPDELFYRKYQALFEYEDLIDENFKNFSNTKHILFIIDELALTDAYPKEKSKINLLNNFNNSLKDSLNSMTYFLEFYLAYLDRKEKNFFLKSAEGNLLDTFGKIDKILTFNYTNTAELKFEVDQNSIHYIHGKQNFITSSIEKNNLVFGIEDNNDKVDTDIMDYQKTFQRIIKKTGFRYKEFIDMNELNKVTICRIIIFGHSLDGLDKEIFLDFFDLVNNKNRKFQIEFFILYYGFEDLKNKVKNLSSYLGKDTLILLSANNNIHFIDTISFRKAQLEITENIDKVKNKIIANQQHKKALYNELTKLV